MATNRAGKRLKKVPEKLKDNGFVSESKRCEKWCTILCIEDNKTYQCNSKTLATDTCAFVTEADLKKGRELIWRYKGIPYSVELKEVHGEKPMPGAIKRIAKYPEDSSDSEDEEDLQRQPPPKKARKTAQAPKRSKQKVEYDSDTSNYSGADSTEKAKQTVQESEPVVEIGSDSSLSDEIQSADELVGKQFGRNADKDTAPTLQNSRLGRLAEGNMLPKKPSHDEKTAHKTAPKQVVEGSQHLTPFQDLLHKLMEKVDRLEEKVDLLLKLKPAPMEEVSRMAPLKEMKQLKNPSENNERFTSDKGVNLLALRAVNPEKYALSVMDALFTDEEMANSCFATSKRSTKPPLPHDRIKLLEDCIDAKFGEHTFAKNTFEITRKCNQKCIDSNKRLKKIKTEVDKTVEANKEN